jgi:hypothetical protein
MHPFKYLLKLFWIALLPVIPWQLEAQNAPITTAATKTACPGATVTVPITVTGFTNIMSVTLRIEYDSTVMHFSQSLSSVSLPGGGNIASSVVSGSTCKIMVVWTNVTPATLSNGSTIATMGFNYVNGTTALTFNNVSSLGSDCEYADQTLLPLIDTPTSTYYFNGQVSTAALGGNVTGGSTIYYGASTGNLTLSGHLGSVLKWQKQYNGEGYTDIPSTAGLTVYSETPSYTGTWDYRAVVENTTCDTSMNSGATSVTVLTPVGTSKTWTGATSSDWKTPTNWNPPGTPVTTDNVIIPTGAPAMPVVLNMIVGCNNLFIAKDATLTVNPANNLQVNGTLTIEAP